jgi:6-phosphogluconolactonase
MKTPRQPPLPPSVEVYDSIDELNEAAARAIVDAAAESVKARGSFTLVLTGGETPRGAYRLLANRYANDIPWDRTDVFFSDERCVPPSDVRSNYRMTRDALLSRVSVRQERVHAIPTTGGTPEDLAAEYESTLRSHLRSGAAAAAPTFDFVLLGMGADGHTASLFPRDPALQEAKRWALAVEAPAGTPVVERITLTLPVVNRARHVVFLVSGEGKRAAVARALHPEMAPGEEPPPAALVHGLTSTRWLLDASAHPT